MVPTNLNYLKYRQTPKTLLHVAPYTLNLTYDLDREPCGRILW